MSETSRDTSLSCGLYPTIITPFFPDGDIDYEGLDRLIAHFARWGVDGIFAVCQSSEMFDLTEEEKLGLADFCIQACHRHGIECLVSGHTQDGFGHQIAYLRRLEGLGPDAIILVSNRLAAAQEGEEVWRESLAKITAELGPDTRLGMYECPRPYHRLLSPEAIGAMLQDPRFVFIKDTCCDLRILRHRLRQIEGSNLRLYNANSATLLESLLEGAAGYSGIQLNFMPEIFAQLKRELGRTPPFIDKAREIADYISATSSIESHNYPANAKAYLNHLGLVEGAATRGSRPSMTVSGLLEMEAFARLNDRMHRRFGVQRRGMPLFTAGAFFPSCHASTVLPLEGGRVLAAYFAGEAEGAGDVGIWLSVCQDGLWLAPRQIAKVSDEAHWNPVLFQTAQGIRLVFRVGREIPAWRSYTMVSEDGGETWGDPVPYAATEEAPGPVRSKPLCLPDGRLLAPNSVERAEGEARWTVQVDLSTDEGQSFQKQAEIPLNLRDPQAPNYIPGKGAIQPTLWQSEPGRLHALLRTTGGAIFRSDSADEGATWCPAYSTDLPSNNSGIDVAVCGGALYLALNPISGDGAPRNCLVILRSLDNGASFQDFCVLEELPFDDQGQAQAEYSYPALVAWEGTLHVSYTWNRRQIVYCRVPLEGEGVMP